jgi:hypothetical protein
VPPTTTPTPGSLWEFLIEYLAEPAPGVTFVELDNIEGSFGGGPASLHEWFPGGTAETGTVSQIGINTSESGVIIDSLVVKAADNGGTGYAQAWQNDPNLLTTQQTWTPDQNMCLIILAAPNQTISVNPIQVFSKYSLRPGAPGGGTATTGAAANGSTADKAP